MLTIGKLAAGPAAGRYYVDQVAQGREDYYAGEGEAPGAWLGSGTTSARAVRRGQRAGRRPAAERTRPQDGRAASPAARVWSRCRLRPDVPSAEERQRALRASASPRSRERSFAAHEAAVAEALGYLEREACRARRGHGGARVVQGSGFVAAGVPASLLARGRSAAAHARRGRELTQGADGRWTALDGRLLYRHAKTAGYLYQAALRAELTERLGRAVASGRARDGGRRRRAASGDRALLAAAGGDPRAHGGARRAARRGRRRSRRSRRAGARTTASQWTGCARSGALAPPSTASAAEARVASFGAARDRPTHDELGARLVAPARGSGRADARAVDLHAPRRPAGLRRGGAGRARRAQRSSAESTRSSLTGDIVELDNSAQASRATRRGRCSGSSATCSTVADARRGAAVGVAARGRGRRGPRRAADAERRAAPARARADDAAATASRSSARPPAPARRSRSTLHVEAWRRSGVSVARLRARRREPQCELRDQAGVDATTIARLRKALDNGVALAAGRC